MIVSYLSGAFPNKVNWYVPVKKNTLVNDGDIKVVANKF